jgi:hypothetical protein
MRQGTCEAAGPLFHPRVAALASMRRTVCETAAAARYVRRRPALTSLMLDGRCAQLN